MHKRFADAGLTHRLPAWSDVRICLDAHELEHLILRAIENEDPFDPAKLRVEELSIDDIRAGIDFARERGWNG